MLGKTYANGVWLNIIIHLIVISRLKMLCLRASTVKLYRFPLNTCLSFRYNERHLLP